MTMIENSPYTLINKNQNIIWHDVKAWEHVREYVETINVDSCVPYHGAGSPSTAGWQRFGEGEILKDISPHVHIKEHQIMTKQYSGVSADPTKCHSLDPEQWCWLIIDVVLHLERVVPRLTYWIWWESSYLISSRLEIVAIFRSDYS